MPLFRTKEVGGKRFGRLTAQTRRPDGRWVCTCDCGKTTIVDIRNLTGGRTTSCRCRWTEVNRQRLAKTGTWRKPTDVAELEANGFMRLGDVARALDETDSAVRYWTDACKVGRRASSGQRWFSPEDLSDLRMFQKLVREDYYSLKGATLFLRKAKDERQDQGTGSQGAGVPSEGHGQAPADGVGAEAMRGRAVVGADRRGLGGG